MLNDFFIYHYGYARKNMDEIMQQKQEYYKGELAKHGGADKKFDQKVKDWFDGSEPVLKFDGEHPQTVQSFYKVVYSEEQELKVVGDWKDDRFYSKVLANEPWGNIWLCMTQQATPHMQFYHNGMDIL
jgi:hypothetical protein